MPLIGAEAVAASALAFLATAIASAYLSDSIGLAYDDECFTYMMYYQQEQPITSTGDKGDETTKFGFNISFRTLWEFGKPVDIGGI